jgi:hypothetical protein
LIRQGIESPGYFNEMPLMMPVQGVELSRDQESEQAQGTWPPHCIKERT